MPEPTTKPIYKQIGAAIRNHRKQQGLTVEELSTHLKLSASYIGLLERGDRCPSLKVVYQLCELFDITPNDLIAVDN